MPDYIYPFPKITSRYPEQQPGAVIERPPQPAPDFAQHFAREAAQARAQLIAEQQHAQLARRLQDTVVRLRN